LPDLAGLSRLRQSRKVAKVASAQREGDLLRQFDRGGEPEPVFILGAPRTGSTALYQAMAIACRLPYISNAANDETPDHPIVGILRSHGQWSDEGVRLQSRHGKTSGEHAPSEGSAILRRWCGGGHPSELVSSGVLESRRDHMAATLRAVEGATGRPLLIKNAWNCFRLASLAQTFPKAGFIWIRRDIVAAAASDLAARYASKSDPNVWNSASPRNLSELQLRPYWEQVVENQFEFSRAIKEAARFAAGRFLEIWYEDFCAKPNEILTQSAKVLTMLPQFLRSLPEGAVGPAHSASALPAEDGALIESYIERNAHRWTGLRRTGDDALAGSCN
jgi:hypothetical protein